MASTLTPEQLQRIEENRKLALQKRLAKQATLPSSNGSPCNQQSTGISPSSAGAGTYIQLSATGSRPLLTYAQSTARSNQPLVTSVKSLSVSANKLITSFMNHVPHSPVKSDSVNNKEDQKSEETFLTKTEIKKEANSLNINKNLSRETVAVQTTLITKDRFVVEMPYNQKAIEVFKTINGKRYDPKTRLWNFPVKEYKTFMEAMKQLHPHVVVGSLPKIILDTFVPKNGSLYPDPDTIDISRVESTLRRNLYPFQEDGIKFGISRGGRCLIADDMGLGKTIQALGIVDYYRSEWPLLIVCPSSMRYQWEEEIHNNLPTVPCHNIYVLTKGNEHIENVKVLIASYDLMCKQKNVLKSIHFNVIIMDESHCLKNNRTQRTKAALELIKNSKRVILLSGTPALSRPAELYTQIYAILPSAFRSFTLFGIRYCEGKKDKYGWNFGGSSNLEELKLFLETRFMIRRLKSEVVTQLPDKIRQVVMLNNDNVDASSDSMNVYADKLKSEKLKGMERRGTLLSYFAETGRAKIKAICTYIAGLLSDGKKFLCFAHHADVIKGICRTLEENETYYIVIDGAVNSEERKLLCDRFQLEDKFKVAVLSIKAANTGLTLTAAQLVVFTELFWNPGELIQAEDRAHRIGQRDSVLVQYLVARGTADDYIWPLIQSKLNVLNKAGLSKDDFMNADMKSAIDKKHKKIIDYFAVLDDAEDDDDLSRAMDEIEGVPEKKMKVFE